MNNTNLFHNIDDLINTEIMPFTMHSVWKLCRLYLTYNSKKKSVSKFKLTATNLYWIKVYQ